MCGGTFALPSEMQWTWVIPFSEISPRSSKFWEPGFRDGKQAPVRSHFPLPLSRQNLELKLPLEKALTQERVVFLDVERAFSRARHVNGLTRTSPCSAVCGQSSFRHSPVAEEPRKGSGPLTNTSLCVFVEVQMLTVAQKSHGEERPR